MAKNKTKNGICSICGNNAELTREHIPPRGIFLSPRPRNTITVLSCKKCNHDTDLDDEYFRVWVTAGAHPQSKLSAVWKNKVMGSSFERSPAFFKKIHNDHMLLLEHHLKSPLKTYDDEIVQDELLNRCYTFDTERLNRIASKIVKGLYFHHFCRVGIIWFLSFRFTLYSLFLRPFGLRSVTIFKPYEELQHPSQNRTCGFPTSGSSD